jgi:chromosome segregation ATPase
MASESREEGAITVELPPDLGDWLDEQAAKLAEPREAVVRQLLASYRATTELDETESLATLFDIESEVKAELADQLDAAAAAAVDEAVADRLDDRFETVETEFQEKVQDVRERVIQLKKELDTKAPEDHEAFSAVEEMEDELTALNRELVEVRDELEAGIDEQSAAVEDIEAQFETFEERLDDTEDKLKRVAWVVNDLREDQGGRDSHQEAVDSIKRAAAQEGISTASCQNCSESVDISLLTEPQCPHCGTTATDVRPEGGIIRKKARLVTAKQLEAGPSDE